jgi:hypothetical protein
VRVTRKRREGRGEEKRVEETIRRGDNSYCMASYVKLHNTTGYGEKLSFFGDI